MQSHAKTVIIWESKYYQYPSTNFAFTTAVIDIATFSRILFISPVSLPHGEGKAVSSTCSLFNLRIALQEDWDSLLLLIAFFVIPMWNGSLQSFILYLLP
jgi:hypothetical protein